MKYLCVILALVISPVANAQTFFGDGNGTSGRGGSCCNWAATSDLNGQVCSAIMLSGIPTCQVITRAQFNAFIAAESAGTKQSRNVIVSTGSPSLGSCSGGTLDLGSTDGQGSISFSGVSVSTSCSLTFGSPPYSGTGCKVDLTGTTGRGVATTTTGFTVSLQGAIPNGKITYFCPQ